SPAHEPARLFCTGQYRILSGLIVSQTARTVDMARTRAYDQGTVVVAAKQMFWQRGLEGTAIGDLEAATGLSRSSLYLAFGTKRALFDAALANYFDTFIDPLL